MESNLAKLSVKLEDAQEQVKAIQQLVKVVLNRAAEVSFPCFVLVSCCLPQHACFLFFAGSAGDVVPQVPFPQDGACLDGRA